MQVVIDILGNYYNTIKENEYGIYEGRLYDIIRNGTPLPKGHGDLKDSEWLDKRLNFILNHTGGYAKTPIGTGIVIAMSENLGAKTIIKADKSESEG